MSAPVSAGLAAQGILAAIQCITHGGIWDEARAVDILTTALENVALLHETNEQLQRDLKGLRDQGVQDAREITRLTDANEALNDRLHAVSLEQQRNQMAV